MRYRCVIVLIVAVSGAPLMAEQTSDAASVVESLHAMLVGVMKEAKQLGYAGRYDRILPVLRETDDWERIGQAVLGKHWSTLNDEQRARFTETFQQLSAATYAANFDGYSGEQFKTVEKKELARGGVMVRSVMTRPREKDVRFDYLLHSSGEKWRIVNIVVDGVSDLALKRAEYGDVMDKQGFDVLLMQMRQRIAAQQAGTEKRS